MRVEDFHSAEGVCRRESSATHGDGVLAEEAGQHAALVRDVKPGAVLNVCAGFPRVVMTMELCREMEVNRWEKIPTENFQQAHQNSKLTAGLIHGQAVNGGHPQVRGARVKQHGEVLRRGADADLPVELDLEGGGGTGQDAPVTFRIASKLCQFRLFSGITQTTAKPGDKNDRLALGLTSL